MTIRQGTVNIMCALFEFIVYFIIIVSGVHVDTYNIIYMCVYMCVCVASVYCPSTPTYIL